MGEPATTSLENAAQRHLIMRVKQHVEFAAFYILLAGIVYHPVAIFLGAALAPSEAAALWLPFHLIIMAGCIAGVLLYCGGRSISELTLALMLLHVGVIAYGVNIYSLQYPEWVSVGSKLIQALVVFFMILCPVVYLRSAFAVLLCYIAMIVYSQNHLPLMQFGLTTDILVSFGCFCIFSVLRWRLQLETKRDFSDQLNIAPKQVVVNAALSGKSVDELFKAKTRFCTCISSDWRGYQQLANQVGGSRLAEALGDYYEKAEEALNTHFPAGNYFADWIADELFVVTYAGTKEDEMQLAVSSLRFALELLEIKERFLKQNGFPASIDVGVTAGKSVIGLMGPAALRKCTALGEVPGRSRRLQEAGKLLRVKLGERDRVVFDRDLLLHLRAGFDVKSYNLSQSESVRDVQKRTLHYLESNSESDAVLGERSLYVAQQG